MLTTDCIVQRNSDVIAAEADQDIVMVSIEKGLYYGVSDVGRAIWEAAQNPIKVSDLINDLMAAYDVDRTTCEQQTLSFLQDLLNEGLLQVENAKPA
jgi:hypothetical protein